MGSQLYIGTANGVVICIDRFAEGLSMGEFWHSYSKEPVHFRSFGHMVYLMEGLFDYLDFPRRANNVRSFQNEPTAYPKRKDREKVMADHDLLEKHGYLETFIVRVQHRQNNTWQGRITWADKDKTVNFRSIWEMIHLMETAIYENAPLEELPDYGSWVAEAEEENDSEKSE